MKPVLRIAPALFLASAVLFTLGARLQAELPIHPEDWKVIERIVEHEQLLAPPLVSPSGWPQPRAPRLVRFHAPEKISHALTVGCDERGRVTHLVGNGPLLSNEAFAWLAALPELHTIRIDHNLPAKESERTAEDYDGSGLVHLKNSKLADFRVTGSFDDDGLRALAEIGALRSIDIFHTRATDAGIAHLANHPNLESASFSPMGAPLVTNRALQTAASLPKLRHLGMQETFLTYAEGFEHLKPLQGRLESLSLKQSLVLPADLDRLRADHPNLKIESSTPAEIAEKPYRARQLLKWASPEAIEYLQAE